MAMIPMKVVASKAQKLGFRRGAPSGWYCADASTWMIDFSRRYGSKKAAERACKVR